MMSLVSAFGTSQTEIPPLQTKNKKNYNLFRYVLITGINITADPEFSPNRKKLSTETEIRIEIGKVTTIRTSWMWRCK